MRHLSIGPRSYSWRPLAALALVLAGTACGTNPVGPPLPPPPLPTASPGPPEVPPGEPAAVLVVTEFRRNGPYGLKLVLAEVGGRSGAWFTPTMIHSDGTHDFGCNGSGHVAAGGIWDMDTLGYCAPEGDGTDRVTVEIRFVDDAGRVGILTAALERQ